MNTSFYIIFSPVRRFLKKLVFTIFFYVASPTMIPADWIQAKVNLLLPCISSAIVYWVDVGACPYCYGTRTVNGIKRSCSKERAFQKYAVYFHLMHRQNIAINSIRAYASFSLSLPCDPCYQRIMHTISSVWTMKIDNGFH